MAQRFKMPDPDYRLRDRFLIDNAPSAKFYRNPETLPDHILQHFDLHLTHQLCINLVFLLIPCNMKLWLLLFKLKKLPIGLVNITVIWKAYLIREHRLKRRKLRISLGSESFSGMRMVKPGKRTDLPCLYLIDASERRSGINADLADFFLPACFCSLALRLICQQIANL